MKRTSVGSLAGKGPEGSEWENSSTRCTSSAMALLLQLQRARLDIAYIVTGHCTVCISLFYLTFYNFNNIFTLKSMLFFEFYSWLFAKTDLCAKQRRCCWPQIPPKLNVVKICTWLWYDARTYTRRNKLIKLWLAWGPLGPWCGLEYDHWDEAYRIMIDLNHSVWDWVAYRSVCMALRYTTQNNHNNLFIACRHMIDDFAVLGEHAIFRHHRLIVMEFCETT